MNGRYDLKDKSTNEPVQAKSNTLIFMFDQSTWYPVPNDVTQFIYHEDDIVFASLKTDYFRRVFEIFEIFSPNVWFFFIGFVALKMLTACIILLRKQKEINYQHGSLYGIFLVFRLLIHKGPIRKFPTSDLLRVFYPSMVMLGPLWFYLIRDTLHKSNQSIHLWGSPPHNLSQAKQILNGSGKCLSKESDVSSIIKALFQPPDTSSQKTRRPSYRRRNTPPHVVKTPDRHACLSNLGAKYDTYVSLTSKEDEYDDSYLYSLKYMHRFHDKIIMSPSSPYLRSFITLLRRLHEHGIKQVEEDRFRLHYKRTRAIPRVKALSYDFYVIYYYMFLGGMFLGILIIVIESWVYFCTKRGSGADSQDVNFYPLTFAYVVEKAIQPGDQPEKKNDDQEEAEKEDERDHDDKSEGSDRSKVETASSHNDTIQEPKADVDCDPESSQAVPPKSEDSPAR